MLRYHPIQVAHHNISIWWCFGSAWPQYLLHYIFESYLLQPASHLCSLLIALCWRNRIHCFVMFRSLGSSGRSRTSSCVTYAVLALLGYCFCWILVQGYSPLTSAQGICPRCSSASRCSISSYQSKRTICTSSHSLSPEASAQSAWWLRFETAIWGKDLAWRNQRARTLPFWCRCQSCRTALNMWSGKSCSGDIWMWSSGHCWSCHFWPFTGNCQQGIDHLRSQDKHTSLSGVQRPMILILKGCRCWEVWTWFSWRRTSEKSRIFGYPASSPISFWPWCRSPRLQSPGPIPAPALPLWQSIQKDWIEIQAQWDRWTLGTPWW